MLEIILDKSFISDFAKYSKEGINIEKILLNDNNTFIISTALIDYIEDNLSGEVFNRWEDLFKYLSDNNKLKSISNCNTLNTDNIYSAIGNTDNYIIILKNMELPTNSNDYTCYLKDTSLNSNFLIKILQNNQITFRSSDFSSNTEIDKFFNKMIDCSKTNKEVIIISRYNNFSCNLIQKVKSKFSKKEYWTTLKQDNCSTNNVPLMKIQLGTSLKVYTGKKKDIHERKIIIGNMILEFDDDFDKIKSSLHAWTGSCIINENIVSSLSQKRNVLDPLN